MEAIRSVVSLKSALFTLLRYALKCPFGESESDAVTDLGVLTAGQWKKVYEMARRQCVQGLLYPGVSEVGIPGFPEDLTMTLMLESGRIEHRSRQVRIVSEGLLEGLVRQGFHPVLMKGPSVAAFYPYPDLRVPGDIDLYLPAEELRETRIWMEQEGYAVEQTPDGSFFCRGEVDVDIHRRYFDLHARESDLPAVPSPEATLLMLSAHILKHAMGTGVGLRQICDMAMAYRALSDTYDPGHLEEVYRKTGLLKWNVLLSGYIKIHLAVQCPFAGDVQDWFRLEQIVCDGGNFGHYAAGRRQKLEEAPGLRKMDTALRLVRKAPFGMRYAPREYLCRMKELGAGNVIGLD